MNKLLNNKSKFLLTDSQSFALEKIDELLSSKNINCAILKGSAGTGKTTLLKLLTNELDNLNIPYKVCTPTGRAAQILRSKGVSNVNTIHSMIYTQDNIVEEETNGDLIYFFNLRINNDPNSTVYLIDESSMISNQFSESEFLRFGTGFLLKDLLTYISINNQNSKKLLFVGDINQLPPVNSSFSPALNRKYLEKEFPFLNLAELELNQIVRQVKDSGVIKNANILKNNLENEYFASLNLDYNTEHFKNIDSSIITDDFCKKYKNDKDSSVLISYTNEAVNTYNKSIREKLFENPSVLEINDRVIVIKNNPLYQLLNGEMAIVKFVSPEPEIHDVYVKGESKPVRIIFRDITIETTNEQNQKRCLSVLIFENLLDSGESNISKLQQRALLAFFRKNNKNIKRNTKEYIELLKNDKYLNCLLVKYGYAITCHKSQGGEWDYVYFDFKYASTYNSDYFRFCYTAITRAKKILFAINSPKSGFNVKESDSIITNSAVTSHFLTDDKPLPDRIETIIENKLNKIGTKYKISHKNYLIRINYLINSLPLYTDICYRKNGLITKVTSRNETKDNIVYIKLKELENLRVVTKKPFDSDDPFLLKLNEEIATKIKSNDFEIEKVEHFSYLERYYFFNFDESCSINIYYKKKNKISDIKYHEGSLKLFKKIIKLIS